MIDDKFNITPAYDILLRGTEEMPIGLYHLGLATTKQLTRLHYAVKSEKSVSKKLRKLADEHYVQIDAIPTKRAKSPYYYALDRKGFSYLRSAGIDVYEATRAAKAVDKQYLFLKHTEELNDIIISAALLKKGAPEYWLDSFKHERELKRSPYKASYQGKAFSIIPDTYLEFRTSNVRLPIIVEHDRGTEEKEHFKRKIRAYIVFLKLEGFKEMFGVNSITIAFSTSAGVSRLGKMREWTWQELQDSGPSLGNVFYFTSLTKPIDPLKLWLEPSWYTLDNNKPVPLLIGV